MAEEMTSPETRLNAPVVSPPAPQAQSTVRMRACEAQSAIKDSVACVCVSQRECLQNSNDFTVPQNIHHHTRKSKFGQEILFPVICFFLILG